MAEPNQTIQLAGAAMILVAYVRLQLGRTSPDRTGYLAMNFVGAALLAVEAGRTRQYGFLALEGAWALASAWALIRLGRKSARERREPPTTAPGSDRSSPPG